jgi:hypothetical protein
LGAQRMPPPQRVSRPEFRYQRGAVVVDTNSTREGLELEGIIVSPSLPLPCCGHNRYPRGVGEELELEGIVVSPSLPLPHPTSGMPRWLCELLRGCLGRARGRTKFTLQYYKKHTFTQQQLASCVGLLLVAVPSRARFPMRFTSKRRQTSLILTRPIISPRAGRILISLR